MKVMDTLPSKLRNWVNGLEACTMRDLTETEKEWSNNLLNAFCDGIFTKSEINEAWESWKMMKSDEILYLESA